MKRFCFAKKIRTGLIISCGFGCMLCADSQTNTNNVVEKIKHVNTENNIVKKFENLNYVLAESNAINLNQEDLSKIGESIEILIDSIFTSFKGISNLSIEDARLVKNYIHLIMRYNFLQEPHKDKITRKIDPVIQWILDKKPIPPCPAVKHLAIMEYKTKFGCEIFVETGTYKGDMVEAQKDNFKQIYSIELGETLALNAAKKFENLSHIKIIQGDSGKVLKKMLPLLKKPTLFWLDGHYSWGDTVKGDKNTPIIEELTSILSQKLNHIILIDDARDFTGKDDYPTIDKLIKFVKNIRPDLDVEVKDDMIRITPHT